MNSHVFKKRNKYIICLIRKKIKQAGTWGRRNGPMSKSAYQMSPRT